MEAMPIPKEIRGQKYICLTTFRKSGVGVNTPVWFAERDDKLYVKTRIESGKSKRIRNTPNVRVAPCTIRGKIIGPEFAGRARILPPQQSGPAKDAINSKYFLARLSLWNSKNEFLEIEVVG
jgi:PPOX class probable F420-dependent enzyme